MASSSQCRAPIYLLKILSASVSQPASDGPACHRLRPQRRGAGATPGHSLSEPADYIEVKDGRLQRGEGAGVAQWWGGELWPTAGSGRVPGPQRLANTPAWPTPLGPSAAFATSAPTFDVRMEAGAQPCAWASGDVSLLTPGDIRQQGRSGTWRAKSNCRTRRQTGSVAVESPWHGL